MVRPPDGAEDLFGPLRPGPAQIARLCEAFRRPSGTDGFVATSIHGLRVASPVATIRRPIRGVCALPLPQRPSPIGRNRAADPRPESADELWVRMRASARGSTVPARSALGGGR